MFKNKDFYGDEGYPCYVEIQVDIQSQKMYSLLKSEDYTAADLHDFHKDEDFKKSINQKDLGNYRNIHCQKNQYTFDVSSVLPGSPLVLRDADINLAMN